VEIHHLRLAFEETTGRDLNWFFDQWFLNEGRPKLKVSLKKSSTTVEVTVSQEQDLQKYPLYRLPLEVDVYTKEKKDRHHIEITEVVQTFTLPVNGELLLVNFDAERQLLGEISYQKNAAEYLYQYYHAPLYGDRLEALQTLAPGINDNAVYEMFIAAAANDAYSHIRNYALLRLEKINPDRASDLKAKLLQMYNEEKNTVTKSKVLGVLNRRFGVDPDVKELNEQALQSSSYAICGEALTMLTRHSPQQAILKAKAFEKESGKDILFAVATLYSNHGGDEQIQFFHESIPYYTGYDVMSFCALYAKTAKRCNDASAVITAATDLAHISRGANKFTRFSALKGIKDIMGAWESKEKENQKLLDIARQENRPTAELEKRAKEMSETTQILATQYDNANK
jgi:aminopeptidase N